VQLPVEASFGYAHLDRKDLRSGLVDAPSLLHLPENPSGSFVRGKEKVSSQPAYSN
jgi:hypothetical protein